MVDHVLIQASELALALVVAALIAVMRKVFRPQFFGSVGWHGGGGKR